MLSGAGEFINFAYILPKLVVAGNASATASNILGSEWLFRIGIISEIIGAILLILCVRALYRLLCEVNKGYASLMVTFVLIAVPISLLNALNQIVVLIVLNGSNFLGVFQTGQLDALATVFLNLHGEGLDVVNILWGLWLIPFGILVYRSGFIPRILGVFLIVACFGYLSESLVAILALPYGNVVSMIADALGALGEGTMMVWLLIRNPQALAVKAEKTGDSGVNSANDNDEFEKEQQA